MRALLALAWVVAAMVLCADGARAAVRVEADEVIFTLKAPAAKEVFLVGDFNSWNPTVEPMALEGDEFVVRLFLVAGTYRYKFVVDGTPMLDPDNRGSAPDQGSPLSLTERSGGLILSTELPEETKHARTATYNARYIGFLRTEDGDSDVEQRVDAGLRASINRLRARAVVATHDSSWAWSPATVDAFFDRGYVDVELGKLEVRAFENDSTWASTDPMGLSGNAGLYGYDAGFYYHGVTAAAVGKHAALRARWADETARADVPRAEIEPASLASFVADSLSETTAYAYSPTFNGSDVLGVEVWAGSGAFSSGYAFRNDTGVNPGLWVDIARRPSDYATQTYATREDRYMSTAWLTWSGLQRASFTFGYGWGESEARAFATVTGSSDLSSPLDAASATTASDATRGILDSDRFVVEASSARRVQTKLRWDLTRFDFAGVEGTSNADVHRLRLAADTDAHGWHFSLGANYTHQRYRDTPDALYIDWPERNVWLSRWDDMDVASMVAIGIDEHTVWTLDATREGTRIDATASALLQTLGVTGTPVHASVRATGDVTIHGPWYAYGDVRVSWYDRAEWNIDDSFWNLYVEGGYRKGILTLSAGFGLDPWAFDPVISDFADIGRTEYLREALAGGVRRSDATVIGQALVEREQELSDLRLFKLECIIDLR